MKSVALELRYPGCTVEQVHAMLADPAFRQAVCERQGVEDSGVSVEDLGGGAMTVHLNRTYGAEFVPSFARSLVGASIEAVQREDWSSPSQGTVDLQVPGKPGQLTGTLRLSQQGDEVVESISAQVKVSIPLVGGRLEDLIAGLMTSAWEAENEVGLSWLAGELA